MKFAVALSVLVASAYGDVERRQSASMQQLQQRAFTLQNTIASGVMQAQNQAAAEAFAATQRATADLYRELNGVGTTVASQMATMGDQMNALETNMGNAMSTAAANSANAMSTAAAATAASLSTTTATLSATLSNAMVASTSRSVAFRATVNTAMAAVDAKLLAKTACNGQGKFLNVTTNQCVPFSTLVLGRSTGDACSTTGAIRINSATSRVEVCASSKWIAPLPVVSSMHRTGGDGCENCWLNRQLSFTKRLADTYIRMIWQDVGRTHGWGSPWNRYHIRVCDSGGGNCGDCQDPGHMRTTRHMHQWHGWWNDHYMPMMTSALCRRRNNANMGAGNYRIRIWCDGSDSALGWNGNHTSIQVDEVYKA